MTLFTARRRYPKPLKLRSGEIAFRVGHGKFKTLRLTAEERQWWATHPCNP